MSDRFATMLSQMQMYDELVLFAATLAVGLIWSAHQLEFSRLPLIVRYRSQILNTWWALIVIVYLVVATTMAVWGFDVG
jgi:hypothetical protein